MRSALSSEEPPYFCTTRATLAHLSFTVLTVTPFHSTFPTPRYTYEGNFRYHPVFLLLTGVLIDAHRPTLPDHLPGVPLARAPGSSTNVDRVQSDLLAVLFALASALTIAWGTVVRHGIAVSAPAGTSPMLTAIQKPMWWAGMSTAIIAYGLQVVALSFGPLLLVQPFLVMSLMFTLPLSAAYNRRRMSRAEIIWSTLLTAAVVVVLVLGRPIGGEDQPPIQRWIPALLIGVVVLSVIYQLGARSDQRRRALLQGLVTGAIFGYVSVLSKAVADNFNLGGFSGLFTAWELYALILAATVGTWVQQNAFNAGALRTSLPSMKIGEPIVAFTLGYAVLLERFQAVDWEWIGMGAALAVMVLSTLILSRKSL